MSIYGMMRTSIAGMAAQANRLSAVADNIANSDTTGYKRHSIEFTSMVMTSTSAVNMTNYSSGIVTSNIRNTISQQGALQFTNSVTDLAIDGAGFFLVQDSAGVNYLTRAGSFVPDSEGNLYNAAGYHLMGYPITDGATPGVANGFSGLERVNVVAVNAPPVATTSGAFSANIPSGSPVVAGLTPAANGAGSAYSHKTSLVAYDNLGNERVVDLYMTKIATNTWEVAVFDQVEAAGAGVPFPYASGPLSTATLNFSSADGLLDPASADAISFTLSGGAPVDLNLAGMTQYGADYAVIAAVTNGSGPADMERVEISANGTLYAGYSDGTFRALFRVPVGLVTSPDQMSAQTGTAFAVSSNSGDVLIGFPDEGAAGNLVSAALEQSNVDIADELTSMIQAQRGYSANSKVFQTGSEVIDIAINLKR